MAAVCSSRISSLCHCHAMRVLVRLRHHLTQQRAEPEKADWRDPAIRDKAKAYRSLYKSGVDSQEATSAHTASNASARSQCQRVARLLSKKAEMAKSSRLSLSSAAKDAAIALKAGQMRDEIEARRQEAMARREALAKGQGRPASDPAANLLQEQAQCDPAEEAERKLSDSSTGSPRDGRAGGSVRSDATPSTLPRRYPGCPWLPAVSHTRFARVNALCRLPRSDYD